MFLKTISYKDLLTTKYNKLNKELSTSIEESSMMKFTQEIKFSSDQGSEKIKSKKSFQELSLFENECIYVFDFDINNLVYFQGFDKLLGFKNHEINYPFIFNNIHPDDAEIVGRIIRGVVLYCMEFPDDSKTNLMTIKYRRRKKDGSYISVLSQASVYERFENGSPSKSVARLTDLSFTNTSKFIGWTFESNNLNKIKFRKKINEAYSDFFTSREIDIISEINNELANKQIAEKLEISIHTVATHRKNIFKKANCINSDELISFCRSIGII